MRDLIAAGILFFFGIILAVLGFFAVSGLLMIIAGLFAFLLSIGVFVYHFFRREPSLDEMPSSNKTFTLDQSKEVTNKPD